MFILLVLALAFPQGVIDPVWKEAECDIPTEPLATLAEYEELGEGKTPCACLVLRELIMCSMLSLSPMPRAPRNP